MPLPIFEYNNDAHSNLKELTQQNLRGWKILDRIYNSRLVIKNNVLVMFHFAISYLKNGADSSDHLELNGLENSWNWSYIFNCKLFYLFITRKQTRKCCIITTVNVSCYPFDPMISQITLNRFLSYL